MIPGLPTGALYLTRLDILVVVVWTFGSKKQFVCFILSVLSVLSLLSHCAAVVHSSTGGSCAGTDTAGSPGAAAGAVPVPGAGSWSWSWCWSWSWWLVVYRLRVCSVCTRSNRLPLIVLTANFPRTAFHKHYKPVEPATTHSKTQVKRNFAFFHWYFQVSSHPGLVLDFTYIKTILFCFNLCIFLLVAFFTSHFQYVSSLSFILSCSQ